MVGDYHTLFLLSFDDLPRISLVIGIASRLRLVPCLDLPGAIRWSADTPGKNGVVVVRIDIHYSGSLIFDYIQYL